MKFVLEPTLLVFIGLRLLLFSNNFFLRTYSYHIIWCEYVLYWCFITLSFLFWFKDLTYWNHISLYIHFFLSLSFPFIRILFYFYFVLLDNSLYLLLMPKKFSVTAMIGQKDHILTASLDPDNVMRWVGY